MGIRPQEGNTGYEQRMKEKSREHPGVDLNFPMVIKSQLLDRSSVQQIPTVQRNQPLPLRRPPPQLSERKPDQKSSEALATYSVADSILMSSEQNYNKATNIVTIPITYAKHVTPDMLAQSMTQLQPRAPTSQQEGRN